MKESKADFNKVLVPAFKGTTLLGVCGVMV